MLTRSKYRRLLLWNGVQVVGVAGIFALLVWKDSMGTNYYPMNLIVAGVFTLFCFIGLFKRGFYRLWKNRHIKYHQQHRHRLAQR